MSCATRSRIGRSRWPTVSNWSRTCWTAGRAPQPYDWHGAPWWRERTFGNTIDSYVELAAAQRNRSIATVRVAHTISGDQIDRLTAALSRQAGRPIAVQVVVDPAVVGGVRVELGEQVIEGTVAGRLENARRTLGD